MVIPRRQQYQSPREKEDLIVSYHGITHVIKFVPGIKKESLSYEYDERDRGVLVVKMK